MGRYVFLVVVVGCGNNLPPPGMCAVATGAQTVDVQLVALPNGPARFDDLRFAPELGKVVAAPPGAGAIALIDPDTLAVQTLSAPPGVESADASATTVYAADRQNSRIVAIDIASGALTETGGVPGTPDYVRFAAASHEVWVSIPATNRLEILDADTLAAIGSVTLAAPPEGLTIDGTRAYSNANGRVDAVDLTHRLVIGEWETGCGLSHGFPQVDDTFQLAFGGCLQSGGVGVVTMRGEKRAGFEAGGDEAVLAYDPSRHHLYLRGDGDGTLDMLATCADGQLGLLARAAVSTSGHASSADDRGHVWVADATTGGVFRITDPFPGAP